MRTYPRRIRNKLEAGERAYGVTVQLPSPDSVEIVGYTGYDFAWIDAEHGTMDLGDINTLIRAADAVGIDAIVRVPDHNPSQAVAHHCADMALRTRAALSQTIFAAVAARDARDDARFQSAAASIVATDAALRNATIAIRSHGGIGFTAECDVHHYLKRAHLFDHISGGTRLHQSTLLAEPVPHLE